jgi:ferredoxin
MSAMRAGQQANPALDIDWTRCDGHGLCAALLPTLISRDEWGFPIIAASSGGATQRELRRAVTVCPSLALRLAQAPQTRHS